MVRFDSRAVPPLAAKALFWIARVQTQRIAASSPMPVESSLNAWRARRLNVVILAYSIFVYAWLLVRNQENNCKCAYMRNGVFLLRVRRRHRSNLNASVG